jgi:hypothetical protein
MRNIKDIESFLPSAKFESKGIEDLLPLDGRLNEAAGDGSELDGKTLSDVKVSDWLWDFNVETKSFPKASVFREFLKPEEDLSVFASQVVNRFALEAWKAIKTKKIFNAAIPPKEKERIKSKLRGFWRARKKLEIYNQEKESLAEFIAAFEEFLLNGDLGASIQMGAEDIVLTKSTSTADPLSGTMSKIFTSLKSFFTKSSWQKALVWLVNNIANNKQHVKWLNTSIYEPNKLSSGTNPDVRSAFDSFVTEGGLQANVPDMDAAMPGIKSAAKLVIEASKAIPGQGSDTWMGALYNTYLFGLYQRMLIIGCCAWVYDLVGDTDIMSKNSEIMVRKEDTQESSASPVGLEEGEYNGVRVYKISYLSSEFKDILSSLLDEKQIGESKFEEYRNRIDARKDSRSIIRAVRMDVLGWGNRNGFRRTDRPDVKGLSTDGSTRLIIPTEMYKKLVG